MPEQVETEWATIGKVVALFGVHGELKVRLLSDIPNRFAELGVATSIFVFRLPNWQNCHPAPTISMTLLVYKCTR